MRTSFLLVAAIAIAALLAAGCGQSDERAETATCSATDVGVTCQGANGDVTCNVTCTGTADEAQCVVTCDGHECSGNYTVTCEHDGDMATCTVTCADGKDAVVTCDGKTVTCEHTDGSKCTFTHPDVADGKCTMKCVEKDAAMPDGRAGCPGSKSGACPGAGEKKPETS